MKTLPFFKSGTLKFSKSGHTLTTSGRHYRCSLDCKGECTEKEPQFKKEVIEKSFSALAKRFEFEEADGKRLYRQVIKNFLTTIILEAEEEIEVSEELAESSLEVMVQDLSTTGNYKKSDAVAFKKAVIAQDNVSFSTLLFSYLIGICAVLSTKGNEIECGRNMALITKHVYLSNDGKIESIEIEPLGWYILNFIDKSVLNYLHNIKIKIINKNEEYCKLNPPEAVKYFRERSVNYALSDYSQNFFADLFTILEKSIKGLYMGNMQEIKANVLALYEKMRNDGQTEMAKKIAIILKKVQQK